MDVSIERLTRRFNGVFSPQQATVLAEAIHDSYADLVKSSDFNELKEIVRGLAQAQARTERRMDELAQAQHELTQAQARTEASMKELAQAQTRTEVEVRNLARELGGLSRSVSYSLENEAYRLLPAYLQSKYGIVLEERLVRTEINGEEVNIFALGQRNGRPIVLVGETKLQFDQRRSNRDALEVALDQLERKVEAVKQRHPERGVVRLLVTHYARPVVLEEARKRDVIIAQSFEPPQPLPAPPGHPHPRKERLRQHWQKPGRPLVRYPCPRR